jgi:hypothetical protein
MDDIDAFVGEELDRVREAALEERIVALEALEARLRGELDEIASS